MEKRKFAGRLTFGVLLIGMGVTFFLNSAGVVGWGVWGELWKYWPILLIIAGINVIFEKSPAWPAAYISPLLVVAVFWFVVTGYRTVEMGGESPFIRAAAGQAVLHKSVHNVTGYEPGEVDAVKFVFNGAAGKLKIASMSDYADGEVAKIVAETYGGRPVLEEKLTGGVLKLEMTETIADKTLGGDSHDFYVMFSPEFIYSLEVNCGASDANLNLSDLKVKAAEINCGAASVNVVLPSEGEKTAEFEINCGAASIKLGVPKGVRVVVERGGLGAVKAEGLETEGKNVYVNKDWHGWANYRVNIELNSAVSDVKLYAYDPEASIENGESEENGSDENRESIAVEPVAI